MSTALPTTSSGRNMLRQDAFRKQSPANSNNRHGNVNEAPVRMLADDPFMEMPGQSSGRQKINQGAQNPKFKAEMQSMKAKNKAQDLKSDVGFKTMVAKTKALDLKSGAETKMMMAKENAKPNKQLSKMGAGDKKLMAESDARLKTMMAEDDELSFEESLDDWMKNNGTESRTVKAKVRAQGMFSQGTQMVKQKARQGMQAGQGTQAGQKIGAGLKKALGGKQRYQGQDFEYTQHSAARGSRVI
jgi:hypothetical protein